jgi:hypothetical protein
MVEEDDPTAFNENVENVENKREFNEVVYPYVVSE